MTEQSWVGRRRGFQPLKFVEEIVQLPGTIPPIVGNKTPLVADQLARAEWLNRRRMWCSVNIRSVGWVPMQGRPAVFLACF